MDKGLKRIGYILLGVGILMIVGSVIQIVMVYTGGLRPAQLFTFNSSDFAIDGEVLFPQLPANLTREMKVEVLPAELLNKLLNLGANTALVGMIIFAGSKIASIGTQILRPVYIKKKVDE